MRDRILATGQEGGEGSERTGAFKAGRAASRRAGAGSAGDRAAWNALFMRPDTVAAAVAAHYGVTRAELLDREASGLPWGLLCFRGPRTTL